MSKVKDALTRKFGPLPAWAWALIGGVGYYYYKSRISSTATATTAGGVPTSATTPQDQTVLQPGESVYDPNTGALTTAPGGDTTGGVGSTGSGGALDPNALGAAIAAGLLNAIPGTQSGAPVTTPGLPSKRILKLKPAHKGKKAVKVSNTTPGLPSKRILKLKPAHKGKKAVKVSKAKGKARSSINIRKLSGGRGKKSTIKVANPYKSLKARTRGTALAGKTKGRHRNAIKIKPLQRATTVQHPVSVGKTTAHATIAHPPSPRPSAPPPRTARTPPKPAPPKRRPRGKK